MTFKDKRVLVTGAAGAVGSAVVQHFAQSGAVVAQLDVLPIDNDHFATTGDLIDPQSCDAAITRCVDALGGIDILANIAGGFTMGEAVHETTDKTWDFMMGLNARSVLNTSHAVVPRMLEAGGGKIVNMAARAGLRGTAAMGAYSASKSVVIRLTEAMADELKERGINVNCIMPSIIDTQRNRSDMPDAQFERWVTPAAIAEVVAFLASPAADPIHGAAIPVEGLS